MIISTINFKQLEDRIDAEYYRPEYLEIESRLANDENLFYLKDLIKSIQHPKEFKREYSSSDNGVPYLRVSNVKDGYIDTANIEYVDLESNIGLNRIFKGNILITRSGTVGIPVLVTDEYDGMLISADFLTVVLKAEIKNVMINPYYIYTFLSSRFGRLQEERKLIGALQKHINTQGLSSVKIFLPSQSFQLPIEKMIRESHTKRKLADEKYKEAEVVLNKELEIEDLDLSTQKTFEAKFSEIDRLDPEQYQPKYKIYY